LLNVIYNATVEVASAIITALATTIVSFLPVFAMQAAEGKLFRPLAFTKTFALLASLVIGIIIIPAMAHIVFSIRIDKKRISRIWNYTLIAAGMIFSIAFHSWVALALIAFGVNNLLTYKWAQERQKFVNLINIGIALVVVVYFLTAEWMPLGAQNSLFTNFMFVIVILAVVLGTLMTIVHYYSRILKWCLANKWKFLSIPVVVILFGVLIWQGANKMFGFVPLKLKETNVWQGFMRTFPGVGKEFMPALDEGSFLLMPTTMPHSGIEENIEDIRLLDMKVNSIPEVESTVGKWGRVSSALDPAPISMFENLVNYKPEYILNEDGHRVRFGINDKGWFMMNYHLSMDDLRKGVSADKIKLKEGLRYDNDKKQVLLKTSGKWQNASPYLKGKVLRNISVNYDDFLVQDKKGEYFRNWRKQIKSPDDIWKEIAKQSNLPGLTSAPKLQPIQTRLIMLQTGMRAPMGVKVFGPDLQTIEKTGYEIENLLKNVPGVKPSSVFADRVVGKPYLEIKIDRKAISRYGLTIDDMQMYISSAIGGMKLTTTIEGRERFPVRVRYAREFRDNPEDLKEVLIPTPSGVQIPLGELAEITYTRGPQLIKSEDTFLVGYVIFDKLPQYAEGDVVENAQAYLKEKTKEGEFVLPAGVNYKFTGNYENQIRATKRLMIVVPISLIVIFLILYFQFKSVTTSGMVFTGIFVAFAGGFLMLWLYGQSWFLNFSVAGMNMRDMFQMHPINLSVAVWVGFIALFGIATDNGVIVGTYLMQIFEKDKPASIQDVRKACMEAGIKRVRPAAMTIAVAFISLLPVMTSTGKGADIMVPMAIPTFGGMVVQVLSLFLVPVLYSMWRERKIKRNNTIETKD
jgi:copper/silver efflux system protein